MINYDEKGFEGKTVLITGGIGFIGSSLAHRLVALKPKKIMIFDSCIPQLGGNKFNIIGIKDQVEEYVGEEWDLRNREKIKPLIKEADIIFNLAGSVSHIGSKENPLFDFELNLRSHLEFLEACKECMQEGKEKLKIVYSGTRDQYGKIKQEHLPVDEKYLIHEATDPQGINKHATEFFHFWYADHFKFDAVSLRLTNTYGPRHIMSDPGQGVLNWFICKAMDGETLELWGGGEQLRDFNYIDDVVEAMLLVALSEKTKGKAYNLGSFIKKKGLYGHIGNNVISIGDVAKMVVKIADKGGWVDIPYPQDRKTLEPGHFYSDATKIYEEVGWEPKISLEEGIRRTIEFYRDNKEHYL
ncbi:NAD-dependent epimerase/dehydratase family protein [archaeon]|jgi:UDP-glucose 4-epimerase|nr:NAD-dependent epimerase/dehydratase family protein [archaeon]MBT4373096.1 NAD-dependent epimerase/dehydratase family protein [archaeon]MBT4531441.1 NAD-dependent epimerase/dehydratase family protein [archaeon]MBT7001381.1 NAD-dependent epimerase/dehydratase family protein [archaeon]MBT7282133.1 NAD-dependent epimerase/dehydratase family protein [archaeon]